MKFARYNCIAIFVFALMMFRACPAMAQHTVKLTWPANGAVTLPAGLKITGYKIYRATTSGAEIAPALTTITDPTVLSFTDATVVGNTTYFYKYTVTASCDSTVFNCSAFIPESAMSPETSALNVPLNTAPVIGVPAAATAVLQ